MDIDKELPAMIGVTGVSLFERALAAIRDIVLIVCGVMFVVSAAALANVVNELQKPAVAQPCQIDPDAQGCGRR